MSNVRWVIGALAVTLLVASTSWAQPVPAEPPTTAEPLSATASGPVADEPAKEPLEQRLATRNPKDLLPFKIMLRGNDALVKEVYWSIIELPADAKLNEESAALVSAQILKFLIGAGYVLAEVETFVDTKKGHLLVTIDEGRLDMIVIEGQGTVSTIQLNFLLNMTHRVFNKFYVDRHVEQFKQLYNAKTLTYELRRKPEGEHTGVQIDLTKLLANPKDASARNPLARRWDLIFTVEKKEWGTGFSAGLDNLSSNGLSIAFGYRGAGLFARSDRWDFGLLGGGTLRNDLVDESTYVAPTRGKVQLRYFSPPITSDSLRLLLALGSDLQGTQRKEFLLEEYFTETLEASLSLYWNLGQASFITLGGGWQSKYLFGVEQLEAPPVVLEPNERHRPFVVTQLDVELGKPSLRADQRHHLALEGRHYFGDSDSYDRFRAAYVLPLRFGWHQLWLKAMATKLWGEVPIGDEERIDGRYIRGVFNEKYFVKEAGAASAEFRYSLTRDQLKLALFADFAFFTGQAHAVDATDDLRWAAAAGPGVNLLLFDAFQLDLYYSFGLNSDEEFEYGFVTAFEKAF